jgi:beta-lactam-binding protein with PASTA domain
VAVSLPYHPVDSTPQRLPVPSVTGRSVREAALALHRRGFRVSLQGLGEVLRTVPAGGEVAQRGSSVTVWAQ